MGRYDETPPPRIRMTESATYVEAIRDRITFNLLAMAGTQAFWSIMEKKFPAAPFDMYFFSQVMESVCRQHEDLRRVLKR
jgi:hypothetical protein